MDAVAVGRALPALGVLQQRERELQQLRRETVLVEAAPGDSADLPVRRIARNWSPATTSSTTSDSSLKNRQSTPKPRPSALRMSSEGWVTFPARMLEK